MGNRVAQTILATVLVAGLLLAIDRITFGPTVREGWQQATSLDRLEIGEIRMPPPYLPGSLKWPPQALLVRTKPAPGWWIGLSDSGRTQIRMWIGSGENPLPQELASLTPCMHEKSSEACPPGWHFASTQAASHTLLLFSQLDAAETKRILIGLEIRPR